MEAVRRWKRDGSTNLMPMKQACYNLRRHAIDPATRGQVAWMVEDRLRDGERIETRLAVFYADWQSPPA